MTIRPRPKRSTGLRLALIGAAVGLIAAGCQKQAPDPGQVVLKVASQKGSTRALMESSHALDGAPYRVEWSEFPSAQTLIEALNAGAVDTGLVGDAPFMFAYASGAKIKVALTERSAAGGASTALIVPKASSIHSLADLKGKRIATGKGSIGHYLLLLVLEKAGLKPSDVTIVYLAPGDAKAALGAGSVDAWATWNPYVALGVLHGEDRVLINGVGVLNALGFQAANQTAIDNKHAQLEDFLHRLTKAYAWQNAHEDEYSAVLAKETGLPPDVALNMVRTLQPQGIPTDQAVITEERKTLAHFQAAGVIDQAPDTDGAFDLSFNDALKP